MRLTNQNLLNLLLFLALSLSFQQKVYAKDVKTLLFLDNSVSNDTYIPSNKENQIEGIFEMAVQDLIRKFPKCSLQTQKLLERAGQLNIFKQTEKIKRQLNPEKTIIIGLIHSSEAMLAAKSFQNTSFQVLSSGATTENLNEMNANFYTLANPVSSFVEVIEKFILERKYKNILSLIPGDSSYAKEFTQSLENKINKSGITFNKIEFNTSDVKENLMKYYPQIKSADLIFAPGFIQQSLAAVSVVAKLDEKKPILGTPNWGRSIPDLANFYSKLEFKKNQIFFPISWIPQETHKSRDLENRFKKKYNGNPMGTAIYTYDAAIIAGTYLCSHENVRGKEFKKYLEAVNFQSQTAREYIKMTSGHMKSKISMVQFMNGQDLVLSKSFINQRSKRE
ncbi:MAG: hypothetical protein ACXVNF_01795 [Neobacillus sp.]